MKLHEDTLNSALKKEGFQALGSFEIGADDGPLPDGCRTLVLIGPGADMWQRFSSSAEFRDRKRDPLDRWSARLIGALAAGLGGVALFPFGGPPHLPFYSWALRTGKIWASPVGLLVHASEGLFVSFRGALALPVPVRRARPPAPRPCDTCPSPCLDACPAGALGRTGYDVPSCRNHIARPEGVDCLEGGCLVRRACPIGSGRRIAAQNAFHMAAFLGNP